MLYYNILANKRTFSCRYWLKVNIGLRLNAF
jgi:hypothetical protein